MSWGYGWGKDGRFSLVCCVLVVSGVWISMIVMVLRFAGIVFNRSWALAGVVVWGIVGGAVGAEKGREIW